MVRNYIRTYKSVRKGISFHPYFSYTTEDVENAIKDVQSKTLTLGKAAEKYNIPKATLARKCKVQKPGQEKPGHPTLFNNIEENNFVEFLKVMGAWGFPMDALDLRMFAQRYLDKIGRTVYTLKDNLPGRDWALNFLRRHKDALSTRLAANISRDRAKVSEEQIDAFFENYQQTIAGVSPDCIINYDETNLTDDPGSKKYIFKRGTKYPERVMNSSKSAVSLMFSGTAHGEMLPIYVVYKSEKLWNTWIEGGPDKTRYNRSKSGWFDGTCFEDWFDTVIIPYFRNKPGRKVIIGDNLSSHFSQKILESCEKYNISFVCLPPKATHIMQPLDVAFYGPLKHYWRIVLTDWKMKEGRKQTTLAKQSFPLLLNKLVTQMTNKGVMKDNIIAGFEKCGLYPVNPERPKSKLPKKDVAHAFSAEASSKVIMDILEELRGSKNTVERSRKKRCDVEPGKSVTVEDLKENSLSNNETQSKKGKGKGKKTVKRGQTIVTEQTLTENQIEEQPLTPKQTLDTRSNSSPDITSLVADTTIAIHQKKLRARFRADSTSSTSVSDTMSVHSDSDCIDAETDAVSDESEQEDESVKYVEKRAEKNVVPNDPGPSTSKNGRETPLHYKEDDTVLVRYFVKKSWKYYVGVVEKKIGDNYVIRFYRTCGKKEQLKFAVPKKIDRDTVPEICILKVVEMLQISEHTLCYMLCNDEDLVYFL